MNKTTDVEKKKIGVENIIVNKSGSGGEEQIFSIG